MKRPIRQFTYTTTSVNAPIFYCRVKLRIDGNTQNLLETVPKIYIIMNNYLYKYD